MFKNYNFLQSAVAHSRNNRFMDVAASVKWMAVSCFLFTLTDCNTVLYCF